MAASASMQGWELTALFLVFLFITLFWEILVGFLTFLNNILRGRKANWLARVKDELLALGVVSLVLLFMEPSIQKICMRKTKVTVEGEAPSYPPSPPPEYGTYYCDAGFRQVFPRTVIHAAHYLLFYLAIVHILFSLLTSVITNARLAKWSALERTARKEQNIPAVAFLRISSVIDRANDPANFRPSMRVRETWRDAIGYVDQDLYSLLRFMCEKRFRAHSVVLRNFNFLNMCEQCLEAELNEVYSHAWLLVFMMALLLLYNRRVYQMIWISLLCVAMMALMAGNMRWVMKKTAREARNLWRKVQGMGGLERDDDGKEESNSQLETGPATAAATETGTEVEPGVALLSLPAALQLQLQHLKHQPQRQRPYQAGRTASGLDVETGDVGAEQRMDQQDMNRRGHLELQLGRVSTFLRPKQLRFASMPRRGGPGPGPIGESLEHCSEPKPVTAFDSAAKPTAIRPLPPLPPPPSPGMDCDAAVAAASATAGGAGWWKSCSTDGSAGQGLAGDFGVHKTRRRGGLVHLIEACRAMRSAGISSSYSLSRNSRSCNSSRCPCDAYCWGDPSCVLAGAPGGMAAAVAAVRCATRVRTEPAAAPVLRCVGRTQHGRLPRLLSSGGGAAAAATARGLADGGGGAIGASGTCRLRGACCRKRITGRGSEERRWGPGPLGEGMVSSNPLYGANDGGAGVGVVIGGSELSTQGSLLGMPSSGYGLQVGMQPQWHGNEVRAPGSGFGAGPPYSMQVDTTARAAPFGSSGTNPIVAAAAAPYGRGSAAAAATAAVADNAQWGSNPSSGSPEAADDSASTGTGSGSASSASTSADHRVRKGNHHSGGRGGGGGGGGGGGEEEDEEDVHSEKSILEHELASGIEEKITRLFFFGRPFLLLWLFNIIFAQASLTMTMSMAFVIPYDKFDYIRDVAMPMSIWLPVVLTNLMLVFYGCWVFLPQYALLSVCGILEPHEVMDEIKRSKTADTVEEGMSAIVLEKMSDYFIGRHDGETRLSTAFIVTLASQAGIILGRDYKAPKYINKASLKPMYMEFMMVWHDIAWYGELTTPYMVKSDVPDFNIAFDELDEDGSGALSFGELANMIRSLGTYATTGDVEAMLWEIDIDNSHSIGFDEFVKFLVYAFFDTKQLGWIDTEALMDGMERLGMDPINEMQASVLMSVGHCDPGEEVKVTLRQFFGMFEKVVFEEVEVLKEAQVDEAAAQRSSFFHRVKDLFTAAAAAASDPSSLCLGPLPESASNGGGGGGGLAQSGR